MGRWRRKKRQKTGSLISSANICFVDGEAREAGAARKFSPNFVEKFAPFARGGGRESPRGDFDSALDAFSLSFSRAVVVGRGGGNVIIIH